MKNIFELMKEFGLELPEDKQKDFEKAVLDNYKTVSDYNVQADKLKTAEEKVTTLTESLDKFKDVNVEELNQTIATLKTDLENKDKELTDKLAERDFMDILKDSIHTAKGKDAERIMKLMDIDTLRSSKNQKEDIAAAIKAMQEDDVTKGMFAEAEPEVVGTGSLIGQVHKPSGNSADAAMRAAMGLPPVQGEQK